MLDAAKLTAGRENYYVQEVTADREEYYTGKGEAPGRWLGRGARQLGVEGAADEGAFRRVFNGEHPESGELLGRKHREDGVRSFDLVFRPTKSVSVLYALGGQEVGRQVLDAHHQALAEAVGYLEEQVGARRGRNGVERVAGGGLLAVGFDHRQSRAGDPLLHTHLIVANRVQGPDGRWTAIDARRTLYPHLMAADAVYRDAYQRVLTRTLGVRWTEADKAGNREIDGIPDRLIKHFSKRREAIEDALAERERRGLDVGAKVANWVAHATRQGKEHGLDEPTLRQRWERAARGQLVEPRMLVERVTGHAREPRSADRQARRSFDLLASPEGLTEQASTFTRQDVIRALGAHVLTERTGQLEELADRFLAERSVAVVLDADEPEERRWSTAELLRTEHKLVDHAMSRADGKTAQVDPVVVADTVERSRQAGRPLGEDQEAMVRGVLTDGQGVSVVVGRAGTGKTTAADSVRFALQRAGFEPLGLAPTGAAAQQLGRDTGMNTATVDSFLRELDTRELKLSRDQVLLLDEAGMVGTRKLQRVLDHARKARCKVVLMGDHRQFQSIDTGGGFRALTNRLGAFELTINRRQRDPLDREAVELIREGRGDEAMQLYSDGGRMHVAETWADCDRGMVDDWWQAFHHDRKDAVMLDHRREDVARLNALAREHMDAAGRLGVLKLTVHEREFRTGDRVVCGVNALEKAGRKPSRWQLGVANGTKGEVVAVNPVKREVRVRLDGETDERGRPREVTLPRWYLEKKTKDGRLPLDHAYAITTHKSQGGTWDRGFVRAGAHVDREFGYVSATRVRDRVDFYLVGQARPDTRADNLDLPPGPDQLPSEPAPRAPDTVVAHSITRSRAQTLATDQASIGQDVRGLDTRALRDEARELDEVLAERPTVRTAEQRRLTEHLDQLKEQRETVRARRADAEEQLRDLGRVGQVLHAGRTADLRRTLHTTAHDERQLTERLTTVETGQRQMLRELRQREHWDERHAAQLRRHALVRQELAWRSRQATRAFEAAEPQWLTNLIGEQPTGSVRAGRRWRQLATRAETYRMEHAITDPQHALGEQPRGDLTQRRTWQDLTRDAERFWQTEATRRREQEPATTRGRHRDSRQRARTAETSER